MVEDVMLTKVSCWILSPYRLYEFQSVSCALFVRKATTVNHNKPLWSRMLVVCMYFKRSKSTYSSSYLYTISSI